MSFCHLHNHSMGSMLDGFGTPEEIAQRAAEIGQSATAITDHGSMAAALKFYDACIGKGVKPLIGVEGYFVKDMERRDKDDKIHHIGLIARNNKGLEKLYQISKIAWNNGFYKKPRFDSSVIRQIASGSESDILALSGCLDGFITVPIREGNVDLAVERAKELSSLFEHLYIEIQPWNPVDINEALISVANIIGRPLIVTADAHYCYPADKVAAEVSLIIQQSSRLSGKEKDFREGHFQDSRKTEDLLERINILHPDRKIRFDYYSNYMLERDEIESLMKHQGIDRTDIYDNTLLVAEDCDISIPRNKNYFPKYLRKVDSDDFLFELAMDKLGEMKLEPDVAERYGERLKEELNVIKTLGFSDYILVIWDIVNYAHTQGIRTGPGRGSVGGSLLAYVLGITRIDPMKHDLLFWRFLNIDESGKSARIEPPDIDLDFADTRRDEVKQYIINRYKNVASIATFNKFTAKNLVRDISRAFGVPLSEVNRVCKQFNTIEEFEDQGTTRWFKTKYPEVLPLAKKFEGRWRGQGMHPAGVVVANRDLTKVLPMESRSVAGREREPVVAYDMDDCASLGLVKMDVLGLSQLSVVDDCLRLIKERHDEDIDLDNIPLDDVEVLSQYSKGHTSGVFQADAPSYTNLLRRMSVDSFFDLVVSNALVRPGPLLTVGRAYIGRKKGFEDTPTEHESIENITRETYNTFIFQEQLMQALVDIGGFSWAESDKVRKIIGKKKDSSEFKPYEDKWMENASQMIGTYKAKKLWSDFEKFAGYAFNKNHAAAYSLLSYQTMWLKTYYPVEYIYALLKNEKSQEKATTYMIEAARLNIPLKLPDVNLSGETFILNPSSIRFGFTNIKGVGAAAAAELASKQPYDSLEELLKKVDRRRCNAKIINILRTVGALNSLDDVEKVDAPDDVLYEYMGIPQGLDSDIDLGIDIVPIGKYDPDNIQIIRGIIKKVVRYEEYNRFDIQDSTGVMPFYCDEEGEEGQIIIGIAHGAGLSAFTLESDYLHRIENGLQFSPFEKFIRGELLDKEKELYNYGVGLLRTEKALVVPVYIRRFKTKTSGKRMATMIVTDGHEIEKVLVFPKEYAQLASALQLFVPIVIKAHKNPNGESTLVLKANGLMTAENLRRMKGIK